jgi:hypothetical protein
VAALTESRAADVGVERDGEAESGGDPAGGVDSRPARLGRLGEVPQSGDARRSSTGPNDAMPIACSIDPAAMPTRKKSTTASSVESRSRAGGRSSTRIVAPAPITPTALVPPSSTPP